MNATLKTVTALLFSAASLSVAASSSIALNSGTIAPNSTLEISLNKLAKDTNYQVQCDVVNDSKDDIDLSFAQAFDPSVQGSVDGRRFSGGQSSISPGEHKLKIDNMNIWSWLIQPARQNRESLLLINNLDFDYSITIKNCIALPLHTHL